MMKLMFSDPQMSQPPWHPLEGPGTWGMKRHEHTTNDHPDQYRTEGSFHCL